MKSTRLSQSLVCVIWFLQIFALSLSAVAPQADDYWVSGNSESDYSQRSDSWMPAQNADAAHRPPGAPPAKCGQAAKAISSFPCRSTLVDPDGDALAPLPEANFIAPDFHAVVLPAAWSLHVSQILGFVLPSLTRRGPPPSDVSHTPFSFRAPPLA